MSNLRLILLCFSILLLRSMPTAHAQTSSGTTTDASQPFWPALTAEELVVAPSPEVASLGKYQDPTVDLSSGQGTLSIGITTLSVRGANINIGLNYRLGGFTTNERPGWFGLGWNLTGMGSVKRIISSQPDEKKPVDIRTQKEIDQSPDSLDYLTDLIDLKREASLDRYSYSLPTGEQGQFYIKGNQIVELPKSNNLIEQIGETADGVRDFRITAIDGTVYEFTEREHTEFRSSPEGIDQFYRSPNYRAVSAWNLSRIITPEASDTIYYSYLSDIEYLYQSSNELQSFTITWGDLVYGCQRHPLSVGATMANQGSVIVEDMRTISSIRNRNGEIRFKSTKGISGDTRYIDGISVYNNEGEIIRTANFKQRNLSDTRRVLEEIRVEADGELIDYHQFTYHNLSADPTGDFFNYPNRTRGNYYPATVIDATTGGFSPRRAYNAEMALHGTMKSSVNSLGVSTTYEFEPNTIELDFSRPNIISTFALGETLLPTDSIKDRFPEPEPFFPVPTDSIDDNKPLQISIGVRLKSITALDPITQQKRVRTFNYADGITSINFMDVQKSDFYSLSGMRWYRYVFQTGFETMLTTTSTLLQSSRGPGFTPEDARIYYGRVFETVSGTGLDTDIRTDYEFDLSQCQYQYVVCSKYRPDTEPFHPNINHQNEFQWHLFRILQTPTIPFEPRPHEKNCFIFIPRQGYFKERIGATPQLKRKTSYRFINGDYQPQSTDEFFYSISQKQTFTTGTFQELMVRRNKNLVTDNVTRDIETLDDFNYFSLDVDAIEWQLDSVFHRDIFVDGSERVKVESYRYSHPHDNPTITGPFKPGATPLDPEDYNNDKLLEHGDTAFKTDTISSNISTRLLISTITETSGFRLEHHTAYSAMCDTRFFRDARRRGLYTLPVADMWVMNSADTLLRRYNYNLFPGRDGKQITRPAEITTSINGVESNRQTVHEYSAFGQPVMVSQTGKPIIRYDWGYGGDLLTGISILGQPDIESYNPDVRLTNSFEYRPMVGCTKTVSPSGKVTEYDYHAGRLSAVMSGEGTLSNYSYRLRSQTEGLFGGVNRISSTTYVDNNGESSTTSSYFDGFGSQVAEVSEGAGADGGDVASVTRYDALGRPIASWVPLPLSADQLSDAMKRDTPLQSAALAEFADATAFSAMTYPAGEASEMPLSATIAGSDFEAHPSRSELTCSNPADEHRRVMRFRWDGSRLSADGFYAAGELSAVRSEDGDGRVTYIFTDCLGRTVLQRSLADDDRLADTYTIADPWGNPLLVIPPEASEQLGCFGEISMTDSFVDNLIDQYCYVYRYDSCLRLRSKKIPGCSPVEFAYDADSRLAFTRDGNQAMEGRRSFVLYDALGRTAVTGTCRDALNDLIWTADDSAIPPMTATAASGLPLASTFCCSGYQVSSEMAADLAEASLLTSTFYDDYTFIPADRSAQFLSAAGSASAISSPKGLATGSLTAVLGPSWLADTIPPLLAATFYDREERPVLTISDTHRGETLLTATDYNLASQPISVRSSILAPDGSETAIVCRTTYDSHGRPVTSSLDYNDQSFNLGRSLYDRLGRLSAVTSEGSITRTSSYDLHGWLSSWQSPGLSQQLLYASGPQANHTGRISSKLTTIDSDLRRYDYSYDRLGRLSAARFSSPTTPEADFSTAYAYDLQGNILELNRRGLIAPGLYDEIDRISASYHGNQLMGLSEGAPTVLLENSLDMPQGHWPSGFYYDRNGNQVSDPSRGIFAIYYNPLNLPTGITMNSGARFDYLYSAAGTKLAEIIYEPGESGTPAIRRDYAGIFEFENSSLARIALASGYITPSQELLPTKPTDPFTPITPNDSDITNDLIPSLPGKPTFPLQPTIDLTATYHLYAFDHQGNILGVYNTKNATLEQTTDYYPYGLPHATPSLSTATNRRLYSAKELTTEAALNTYDFAARWQSPAFPHFTTPDPLAEQYTPIGPQVFCGGDPINRIDPSGTADFWYNGEVIGNDGVNDGKVYVIMSGKASYSDNNYDCPGNTTSKENIKKAVEFIQNAMSNKTNGEIKNNKWIYETCVEIEGSAENRQAMVNEVSKDKDKSIEGSNFREYGGYIRDGKVVTEEMGKVADPFSDSYASIVLSAYNNESTFHSHPSGIKTIYNIQGESNSRGFRGLPSPDDLNTAGTAINYVFDMGHKKVYIYDGSGIKESIPLDKFVKPKYKKY